MNSNTQPHMKELLGLCSGRFSDSEDSRTAKNVETQDNTNRPQRSLTFNTQNKQFDMNELLGLCSGKFTDGENEIEDDGSRNLENDSENSECELGVQGDKSDDADESRKLDENSDREEDSDPEEMIIHRKYVKKYEAKKRWATSLPDSFIILFVLRAAENKMKDFCQSSCSLRVQTAVNKREMPSSVST